MHFSDTFVRLLPLSTGAMLRTREKVNNILQSTSLLTNFINIFITILKRGIIADENLSHSKEYNKRPGALFTKILKSESKTFKNSPKF